uniref:Uncharacterized protein n=1 Tax=Pristionchus pacificus TaxID=54126 RepID=A0A2A6B4H4_PRIPA|eukprot:PDM60758.1 hypothetical protein PRIPAC_54564 [Pristionchus pacificus]
MAIEHGRNGLKRTKGKIFNKICEYDISLSLDSETNGFKTSVCLDEEWI